MNINDGFAIDLSEFWGETPLPLWQACPHVAFWFPTWEQAVLSKELVVTQVTVNRGWVDFCLAVRNVVPLQAELFSHLNSP